MPVSHLYSPSASMLWYFISYRIPLFFNFTTTPLLWIPLLHTVPWAGGTSISLDFPTPPGQLQTEICWKGKTKFARGGLKSEIVRSDIRIWVVQGGECTLKSRGKMQWLENTKGKSKSILNWGKSKSILIWICLNSTRDDAPLKVNGEGVIETR